ncbi:hypothetical protein [Chryseobacterium scophthalmum]|nr:hypothetical protein [Chryseobacterium scophthalmum]
MIIIESFFSRNFPSAFIYFYNEHKNLIEIYSVFHTSRNPEQWKDRK